MEFLIFRISRKSTETSRHVQTFFLLCVSSLFSSSYRRQSINIPRIRMASRPTGKPPPVSPVYYGPYLNATSRAKTRGKKTNKNGECGETCFEKAASRFHWLIICQQSRLACLYDVCTRQTSRQKKNKKSIQTFPITFHRPTCRSKNPFQS